MDLHQFMLHPDQPQDIRLTDSRFFCMPQTMSTGGTFLSSMTVCQTNNPGLQIHL